MHWIVYLGITLFSAIGTSICAQSNTEVHVDLEMPYDTFGLGELVQVSLVFHNTRPRGEVQLPTVAGLEWSPQSTTHKAQYINGVQTRSVIYHYTAQATELGMVIIPSFEIETDDGYWTTSEKVTIVVPKAPQRFQQEQNAWSRQSPFSNDPFFQQNLSPFSRMDDMEKRMKQLRKEMHDHQLQQIEKWEQHREKSPSKKSKKQRKTYRI